MTTHNLLDLARIKREAEKFYEYVVFSHRWKPPEPSFQMIENAPIYGLPRNASVRADDCALSRFKARNNTEGKTPRAVFNVALPVIYGEGNQAVGRLLEHILTRSDNVIILAWTGNAGGNHSYLPSDITVYASATCRDRRDRIITALHSSFPDSSPIVQLYKRLNRGLDGGGGSFELLKGLHLGYIAKY